MTTERIYEIFEDVETSWEGDNLLQGIEILKKYVDDKSKCIIEGAEHDIVYLIDVDQLIELNVTEEDLIKLAKLNFHIDEECDCLACFV